MNALGDPGRRVVWTIRTALGHRGMVLLLVIVAMALTAPSLTSGLHLDDYVLLAVVAHREPLRQLYPSPLDAFNFIGGAADRTRAMLDLGLLPWWTFPDLRMAFWRPLTALTHWLDVAAWPDRPFLMHAQNLAWFAIAVVAGFCTGG